MYNTPFHRIAVHQQT